MMLAIGLFALVLWRDARAQQTCLANPPEVFWDEVDGDNPYMEEAYESETWFQECTFDVPALNLRMTTRLFDCELPAKTIRFRRGNEYRFTVYNDLPENTEANALIHHNERKDPNTVNIHTHGPHISGMFPGDTVFVDIESGQHNTYEYVIPCDHAGGTFWWHPHHHGSTDAHVAGGAAGFVIVEDDAIMEGLPDWYENMPQLLMMIQYIDLGRTGSIYSSDVDEIFGYEAIDGGSIGSMAFALVNGEYQPTICLDSAEWTRLRIAHVDGDFFGVFYIAETGCQAKMLSRDGVIIHGETDNDVPRDVDITLGGDHIWLSEAGRVDLAVWCDPNANGGTYTLMRVDIWALVVFQTITKDDPSPGATAIATISVSGSTASAPSGPASFTPIRPPYLVNMVDSVGKRTAIVNMSDTAINGQSYQSEECYFFEADMEEVFLFDMPSFVHTLHVHVNHMQVQSSQGMNPAIWQQKGDYVDSFLSKGTAWYYGDTFGGTVVLHCHILKHEDEGVFTTLLLKGGCASDYYSHNDRSYGECVADYTQCAALNAPPEMTNYGIWHTGWHNGWLWNYHSGSHWNWWRWFGPRVFGEYKHTGLHWYSTYWWPASYGYHWGLHWNWWRWAWGGGAEYGQVDTGSAAGLPSLGEEAGSGFMDAYLLLGAALGILIGALSVIACVCCSTRWKNGRSARFSSGMTTAAMTGASTTGVIDNEQEL